MSEPIYEHIQLRVERGVLVMTILEMELRTDLVVDGLRDELLEAVARHGARLVVVDLQKVRYLGSAGFQPLLVLHRKLQGEGGRLLLCGLSPVLTEVFRVTKLMRSTGVTGAPFESEADVAAALTRLAGAGPAANPAG
jgi:anti-anti-sigma factor